MKRILMLCVLLGTMVSGWATYYVAGNGSTGNAWCDGKSWVVTGSAMTLSGTEATITFSGVPAGSNYQFKVTQGSWSSTSWGYSSVNQSGSNITCYSSGSDANVQFSTSETQNITISFNTSTKKITVNGDGNNDPDTTNVAVTGVPSESEDVMLQAFYWNSYTSTTYGNTRRANLLVDTVAIRDNFDLVWFPPAGIGDGVGYTPKRWCYLSNSWGDQTSMQTMIAALHRGGCKAIADIVVNHRGNQSTWCDFYTEDFGSYGTYQLTASDICSNDEGFTDTSSSCYGSSTHGASDTGSNFEGARDLDHTSSKVQKTVTAYVKWMKNVWNFDGFRYDMTLGYAGNYLSLYNVAADPYISVSECWSDIDTQLSHLRAAKYNTMVFDFPLKYVLNNTIGKGTYAGLKKPSNSFRGRGQSKYGVTFIDNHDTFERSDENDGEFIGEDIDITNTTYKSRILQANAYILMMPGIPCVFWPHWYTFKDEINALIAARKEAGIHSESVVSNESAGTSYYTATIQGHRRTAILRIGTGRDQSVPAGYYKAVDGTDYTVYLSTETTPVEIVTESPVQKNAKRIVNGHLVIDTPSGLYDAMGRKIQ